MIVDGERFSIRTKDGWKTDPSVVRQIDRDIFKFIEVRGVNMSDDLLGRVLFLARRRRKNEVDNFSKERQSHLEDVGDIMRIVPEDVQLAALLHDVGKTGPRDIRSCYEEGTQDCKNECALTQKLIVAMFAYPFEVKDRQKTTVSDLVEALFGHKNTIKLITTSINKEKAVMLLKVAEIDMGDPVVAGFFDRHTEWGVDVLNSEEELNNETKYMVANHHAFLKDKKFDITGFDPTDEILKKTFYLEVVDYYQARRKRGDLDHASAWSDTEDRFQKKLRTKEFGADTIERYETWLDEVKHMIEEKQARVFETK